MNSINNDNTILPIFSSNNNRNILIKTLVENNSSINQIDSYGRTPLIIAINEKKKK